MAHWQISAKTINEPETPYQESHWITNDTQRSIGCIFITRWQYYCLESCKLYTSSKVKSIKKYRDRSRGNPKPSLQLQRQCFDKLWKG